MPKRDVLAEVTQQIIDALEAGVMPWRKPWDAQNPLGGGPPYNLSTGKPYQGVNILLLWASGRPTQAWLTYRQAQALGGNVRKGEKGTTLVKWVVKEKDDDGETFAFPRPFTVFNVDQIDGLDEVDGTAPDAPTSSVMEVGAAAGARMRLGGNRAYYDPRSDVVRVPERARFNSSDDFEATLAHELVHWTGHPSRLDRTFGERFGDEAYAFEELVAEIGAAFLSASLGLRGEVQGHASYVDHWLTVLRRDKRAIVTAASAAGRAVSLLLQSATESEAA